MFLVLIVKKSWLFHRYLYSYLYSLYCVLKYPASPSVRRCVTSVCSRFHTNIGQKLRLTVKVLLLHEPQSHVSSWTNDRRLSSLRQPWWPRQHHLMVLTSGVSERRRLPAASQISPSVGAGPGGGQRCGASEMFSHGASQWMGFLNLCVCVCVGSNYTCGDN